MLLNSYLCKSIQERILRFQQVIWNSKFQIETPCHVSIYDKTFCYNYLFINCI